MGRKSKKAPHHGNPWLTEQEIGDQIWESKDLQNFIPFRNIRRLREPRIANCMIPDFVFIGEEDDYSRCEPGEEPPRSRAIAVVELKITAEASSLVQLFHYANLIRAHANGAGFWTHGASPSVLMVLIARYFDKSCAPFIEHFGLNLMALRADVGPDRRVRLKGEFPEFAFNGYEDFNATLFAGIKAIETPAPEVSHGANP